MPIDLEAKLATFLQEEAARPFVWGVSDCATFGMGWAERLTGLRSPDAKPLPRTLKEFIRRQRDLPLRLEVGAWLRPLGFSPVSDLRRGDIGVLVADKYPTVGIRLGSKWAVKAGVGFCMIQPVQPALAWRLG